MLTEQHCWISEYDREVRGSSLGTEALCKKMPAFPVNRVVDEKIMIGIIEKWG
jgi:hypothetical protein